MNNDSKQTHDALLALRCQLGEASAFRDLVIEFERPLAYFISKILGDRDSAWDVLQQVWIRVFRKIRYLDHPNQLRPWLYQMAHGIAVDHLRKQDSIKRVEQEYASQKPQSEEEIDFGNMDATAIHIALDRIELRLREVLTLHFLDDLSVAQIAQILSCPEGTVKSRLHHARRALRDQLKETQHD